MPTADERKQILDYLTKGQDEGDRLEYLWHLIFATNEFTRLE